mgnify:CR=1 FL=1
MSAKRGRPGHAAHAMVLEIAEGFMAKGDLSPSEAVRKAIDAAVDLQLVDSGTLFRNSSELHPAASLTAGADEDCPPPWPVGTLAARDTVVEQIARKLRQRIKEKL